MYKVKKYDDFINEELNMRKSTMGLIGAGVIAAGVYYNSVNQGKGKLQDTEIVGNESFKEYNVYTSNQNFDLNISGKVMVSHHSYKSGKHTKNVTNITVPSGIDEIWYKTGFLSTPIASVKPFHGAEKMKISDLDVYKSTDKYTIYSCGFFSPFDYVIVNNGYSEGDEYRLSDDNIAVYSCKRYDSDIYIFGIKSLGGAKYGGAGAGGEF